MSADPTLANVNADMTAWRLFDQLRPCGNCGCVQQDHDDDDRCTCGCGEFVYAEECHDEQRLEEQEE